MRISLKFHLRYLVFRRCAVALKLERAAEPPLLDERYGAVRAVESRSIVVVFVVIAITIYFQLAKFVQVIQTTQATQITQLVELINPVNCLGGRRGRWLDESDIENAQILWNVLQQLRVITLDRFIELVLTSHEWLAHSSARKTEDRMMASDLIVEWLEWDGGEHTISVILLLYIYL